MLNDPGSTTNRPTETREKNHPSLIETPLIKSERLPRAAAAVETSCAKRGAFYEQLESVAATQISACIHRTEAVQMRR